MKKLKFNLGELKVTSFTTSLEGENAKTVKGGLTSIGNYCSHVRNGCMGSTHPNFPGPRHTQPLFCN